MTGTESLILKKLAVHEERMAFLFDMIVALRDKQTDPELRESLNSMKYVLSGRPDCVNEAAARLRSMEEALSREERAHEQTVDERDIAQATADRLADLIAQITGVEIGEHRAGLGCPGNDPHLNAIDAAEGFLHARAALSGEGQ